MHDGSIETWEINLNPTLARYPELPSELDCLRRETIACFHARFRAAWEQVDLEERDQVPVTVGWSAAAPATALVRQRRAPWVPLALRRALRPAFPALLWVLQAMAPLLMRNARVRP